MQKCIIIDIDGTIADVRHRLHHIKNGNHDWGAFFDAMDQDPPTEMLKLLRNVIPTIPILLVSGRPNTHRSMTEKWLGQMQMPYHRLFMRETGDHRQDTVVKQEILDRIKTEGYNPVLAIDDRPSIIKLWRDNNIDVIEFNVDRWNEGPIPPVKPYLVMLIGPSCAGKSTWAEKNHTPDQIISTDKLRAHYCGNFRDQSRNDMVYHAYHKMIETRMSLGLLTVADATNIRTRDRRAILNLCPENASIYYTIINRPMVDKERDMGWRAGINVKGGVPLIYAHQQTFNSNLKAILKGDDDPRVVIVDRRT